MCVHASGSVWVWNHDGWAAEEQRAGDCVHRRAVRLHPSPLNAAAAAAPRLRDTMLTSQWILGDLSCQVAGFKPREDAIHNSILILYLSSFYLVLHLLLFTFTLLLFPFCSPISVFAFLLFHVSLSPPCEDISPPSRRFPGRHHSFPHVLSLSNSHPAKEQFKHVNKHSPFNHHAKHFYMLGCFDVTRQLELCTNL